MPALGERFRAAREARGLTLSDVSEQLRIRAVYLAAIEEENWPAIGAAVYARGFLRTYARFLGLDPEESVAAFNASSGAAAPASTPDRRPSPRALAGHLDRQPGRDRAGRLRGLQRDDAQPAEHGDRSRRHPRRLDVTASF